MPTSGATKDDFDGAIDRLEQGRVGVARAKVVSFDAASRALENQIYFLSLNRAGRDYGNSVFCLPWVDETRHPVAFHEHDEQLLRLMVDRAEIDQARESYSFLEDRIDSYG